MLGGVISLIKYVRLQRMGSIYEYNKPRLRETSTIRRLQRSDLTIRLILLGILSGFPALRNQSLLSWLV